MREPKPPREDSDQGLILTVLNWCLLAVLWSVWLVAMTILAVVAVAWVLGYGTFVLVREAVKAIRVF